MKDDQKRQWEGYSDSIEVEDISSRFKNPHFFHIQMAELIDHYCHGFESPVVAEVGCETGITLMLTKNATRKIFLDYDEGILNKLKCFLEGAKMNADIVCEDMFDIHKINTDSCDIAFNSGVIEHYNKSDRAKALSQYAKILKNGGYAIIAYPNHFSFFYKFAYVARRFLGKKYWPWPPEYTIKDLADEMSAAGLDYCDTVLLDRETLVKFYPNIKIIRSMVDVLTKMLPSERYLRVCIGKKSNLSQI